MKSLISKRNGISFWLAFMLLTVFACQLKQTSKIHVVEIKDMEFRPAELIVQKGDTVMWINKDIVVHTVTERNKSWASPLLSPETTWKRVIEKNDSYYCSIHINMKGELIVEIK